MGQIGAAQAMTSRPERELFVSERHAPRRGRLGVGPSPPTRHVMLAKQRRHRLVGWLRHSEGIATDNPELSAGDVM